MKVIVTELRKSIMVYATHRIKGCLCWINYSMTCYSLVWEYFKKQMLNTAKTSVSNCHIYFMKEKRAGKLHKLELVSIFMGILSLMPNIDWIIESTILPAALRDPWDFSLFPFQLFSFHISHEHGHWTFYCLLFLASYLMVWNWLAAFLPSTHTFLCL